MSTTKAFNRFPIGTPGTPWGESERQVWRGLQNRQRDYFTDIVSPLHRLSTASVTVFKYGELDYRKFNAALYPLFAVKSKEWNPQQPLVIVTGGVHGYETSGAHGALRFAAKHIETYTSKGVNVLVFPCVSPWGYETINRWTPEAIDPNRQFIATPGCEEAALVMKCVREHEQQSSSVLMHMDLHETTDTDNDVFRPAKSARDGEELPVWSEIPDGFYLIGDVVRPELAWHEAVIDAVSKVTHICKPDENGEIAGEPAECVKGHGILICEAVGDCASFTSAKYSVTTEVYPDSRRTSAEECVTAQVRAVTSSLDFVLSK